MDSTMKEMALKLGVSPKKLGRLCRTGLVGLSGERVKLERWRTEKGFVTNDQAVRLFRERLNDPLYSPEEDQQHTA